jgi:hypothetical protein
MCLVKYSARIPDRTYWSEEGVAGPLAKDEVVGRRAFPCPYPSTPRLWKALVARGGLFGRRWALVNRAGGTCHEQRNVFRQVSSVEPKPQTLNQKKSAQLRSLRNEDTCVQARSNLGQRQESARRHLLCCHGVSCRV